MVFLHQILFNPVIAAIAEAILMRISADTAGAILAHGCSQLLETGHLL